MSETIRYQNTLESSRNDGSLEHELPDGKTTFGKLAYSEDIYDKHNEKPLSDILKENGSDIENLQKYSYPRVVKTEDELNEMIENGGPFEEGVDYLAYEDDES